MCSLISTFNDVFSDRTLSYLCSFQMNQPQSTPFYTFRTICLGLHQLHKKLHVRGDFTTSTLLQLISPINRIKLKRSHINLSWFSCGSSSLIDRFCVERGTGKTGEKTRSKARINNKLNPHMTPVRGRTCTTSARGERSHHDPNPAPRCWSYTLFLKWYYDENCIFPIQAILKHKQVACMRRKVLFTIFKYIFSFQGYSSF